MKRLKIMKSYLVLWLFIYFLVHSNIEAISVFFFATLTFNLAVLTLMTIGIIMLMKAAINLVMLAGTFGILAYKKDNLSFYLRDIDKIMPANIAHMFNARAEKGVLLFTVDESRDVIEWIEEKFTNQNRYTNYFIGTVLMIGLLGTFSGLLVAIDDMGRIILSLSGDIDLAKVISDFSGPLGGMAVGFGSSLFGVIAAIILGLMGYILNKNQEVLIEGVEDWLKGRIIDAGTTTTSTGLEGNNMPDQKASFMDVFIDNISTLSKEMAKMSQTNERLNSVTIASIQAARDEHETSIEIFEDISASLKNIDTNAQNSTNLVNKQFELLQTTINTNHAQLVSSQKESILTLIDKIEIALKASHEAITQKFQTISEYTSNELREQASYITTLLKTIDTQLIEKQRILSTMQISSQENQEINENLLKQLVSLFEESSSKLDVEQETLSNIYKELEIDNQTSKEHFESITDSLSSLSSTLKSEVQSLVSLELIQKEQSQVMKESAKTSQDIRQTLLESQMQSFKQEEHLSTITSKIELVKEQLIQSNEKSSEMIGATMKPLQSILEVGNNQHESIKELVKTNEENAKISSNHLTAITSELESVNEQIAIVNNNSLEMINKSTKEFEALLETDNKQNETLEKLLEINEQDAKTSSDKLSTITSELESVNEQIAIVNNNSIEKAKTNTKEFQTLLEADNKHNETLKRLLEINEQSVKTNSNHLTTITSELESVNEQMSKVNEKSIQMMDANKKEFKVLVDAENKQHETLEKLFKADKRSSDTLTQIQKNTAKLKVASSHADKKSGGFFKKMFS